MFCGGEVCLKNDPQEDLGKTLRNVQVFLKKNQRQCIPSRIGVLKQTHKDPSDLWDPRRILKDYGASWILERLLEYAWGSPKKASGRP